MLDEGFFLIEGITKLLKVQVGYHVFFGTVVSILKIFVTIKVFNLTSISVSTYDVGLHGRLR